MKLIINRIKRWLGIVSPTEFNKKLDGAFARGIEKAIEEGKLK